MSPDARLIAAALIYAHTAKSPDACAAAVGELHVALDAAEWTAKGYHWCQCEDISEPHWHKDSV